MVNRWHTPPESADLYPIENLWHELKEYLRAQIKPRTWMSSLLGLRHFGQQLTLKNIYSTCEKLLGFMNNKSLTRY